MNENVKTIIAICGKSGSGKDSLEKLMCKLVPIAHPIVSHTTRPKREYETDGVDYHYVTDEQFLDLVVQGQMLEASYFNHWHYGTSLSSLQDGLNVGVFNPDGLDALLESSRERKDLFVLCYYLDVDGKTRLLRQLNREEHPDVDEIIRRYSTDEVDFGDINLFPITALINDTPTDLYDNILIILDDIKNYTSLFEKDEYYDTVRKVIHARDNDGAW